MNRSLPDFHTTCTFYHLVKLLHTLWYFIFCMYFFLRLLHIAITNRKLICFVQCVLSMACIYEIILRDWYTGSRLQRATWFIKMCSLKEVLVLSKLFRHWCQSEVFFYEKIICWPDARSKRTRCKRDPMYILRLNCCRIQAIILSTFWVLSEDQFLIVMVTCVYWEKQTGLFVILVVYYSSFPQIRTKLNLINWVNLNDMMNSLVLPDSLLIINYEP